MIETVAASAGLEKARTVLALCQFLIERDKNTYQDEYDPEFYETLKRRLTNKYRRKCGLYDVDIEFLSTEELFDLFEYNLEDSKDLWELYEDFDDMSEYQRKTSRHSDYISRLIRGVADTLSDFVDMLLDSIFRTNRLEINRRKREEIGKRNHHFKRKYIRDRYNDDYDYDEEIRSPFGRADWDDLTFSERMEILNSRDYPTGNYTQEIQEHLDRQWEKWAEEHLYQKDPSMKGLVDDILDSIEEAKYGNKEREEVEEDEDYYDNVDNEDEHYRCHGRIHGTRRKEPRTEIIQVDLESINDTDPKKYNEELNESMWRVFGFKMAKGMPEPKTEYERTLLSQQSLKRLNIPLVEGQKDLCPDYDITKDPYVIVDEERYFEMNPHMIPEGYKPKGKKRRTAVKHKISQEKLDEITENSINTNMIVLPASEDLLESATAALISRNKKGYCKKNKYDRLPGLRFKFDK